MCWNLLKPQRLAHLRWLSFWYVILLDPHMGLYCGVVGQRLIQELYSGDAVVVVVPEGAVEGAGVGLGLGLCLLSSKLESSVFQLKPWRFILEGRADVSSTKTTNKIFIYKSILVGNVNTGSNLFCYPIRFNL
jgi:hypothetical protein